MDVAGIVGAVIGTVGLLVSCVVEQPKWIPFLVVLLVVSYFVYEHGYSRPRWRRRG